jgi:large subunit ribosomal protein L15
MRLNTLSPAEGSTKNPKRRGRGIGSNSGKTGGRGHKGQSSRSGGYTKVGFEGGQMPLQRRLPKFGFTSRKSLITADVRLDELAKVEANIVDLASLQKAGIITSSIKFAKIMLSGKVEKAFIIKGIKVTKGAREAIVAAGGKIED